MTDLAPLHELRPERFETAAILKKLATASRQLAELKGIAASIPHQGILINTLGMQEAKDSSAIENIVTTHDELYKDEAFPEAASSPAAKEVLRYRQALWIGFEAGRRATCLRTATSCRSRQSSSVTMRGFVGFRERSSRIPPGTPYTPRRRRTGSSS
jgi:hypothetical protein